MRESRGRGIVLLVLLALLAGPAGAAGPSVPTVEGRLSDGERRGLELQVELNRLGSSGDPIEREAILRKAVEQCQGAEEGEAAYWGLSDLYLDAFPEPKEREARDVLELLLKRCPDSRWATQAKCRLLTLYDPKDKRAAQLRRELLEDKGIPQMLRAALKGQ